MPGQCVESNSRSFCLFQERLGEAFGQTNPQKVEILRGLPGGGIFRLRFDRLVISSNEAVSLNSK